MCMKGRVQLRFQGSRFRARESRVGRGRRRRIWTERETGPPPWPRPGNTRSSRDEERSEDDVEALKRKSRAIEARLRHVRVRIREIEQGHTTVRYQAVVDPEKCAGCGVCLDACPTGALSLEEIARIDPKRCIGCGRCLEVCPQGAISLRPAGGGLEG